MLLLTCSIISLYSSTGALTTLMMTYAEGVASAPSTGYFNSISNLGGLLGPVVLGLVKDRTGSYGGAFLAMGLPLLGSGIMALLAPNSKHKLHDATFC